MANVWTLEAANSGADYAAIDDSGNLVLAGGLTATGGTFSGGLTFAAGVTSFLNVSALATGEADIVIGDNLADAFTIREGTNAYLTFVTTNSSESVTVAKSLKVTSGTVDLSSGATDVKVPDNNATALRFREGTNDYVTLVTSDSAEQVKAHKHVALAVGGGWTEEALAGNRTLTYADAQFLRFDANGSNRDVTLPAVAAGLFFRIVNTSAGATNLVVKNAGAATIGTLNQNEAAWFVSSATAWQHMGIEAIALT